MGSLETSPNLKALSTWRGPADGRIFYLFIYFLLKGERRLVEVTDFDTTLS